MASTKLTASMTKLTLTTAVITAIALCLMTPSVGAQVYAYEEDFDRGYPGAGPFGYYHRICQFECPDVWSPVCATDGYSYPSGCHLFVASCWKRILGQKGIQFWYGGVCLIEGATHYDPGPGLKERRNEERQRKIDAGEPVPTLPPDDVIYINGQPYRPPYNPAPTSAPSTAATAASTPYVTDEDGGEAEAEAGEDDGEDVGDYEEEDEDEQEGEEVEDQSDAPSATRIEGGRDDGFVRDEIPIESRRRRRRRSLDSLLKMSPPRRQRRHRHRVDGCKWACPLITAPICASDGKTHFNKCHFLRRKCRRERSEDAATAATGSGRNGRGGGRSGDGGDGGSVDAADGLTTDATGLTKTTAPAGPPAALTAAADAAEEEEEEEEEVVELVIRHAGRCGKFLDASTDARVRECVTRCGERPEDRVVAPVCASDRKTYLNSCFYQQAKCLRYLEKKSDLHFMKMGFC